MTFSCFFGERFALRALLLGGLLTASIFPATAAAQTAATYHNEADAALQSFLVRYWNGGSQYINAASPGNGSLTGYWTYAQAWDALLDGVERTNKQQYYGLIESFYLGQNSRGWSSSYYDDETWMTLALIRSYDLTGDSKYLNQAKSLYANIKAAWDTSCCGSTPGGIWWDTAHTQKATASNAGPVIAGALLYQRTGDASDLSFAQQVYNYWWNYMVNQTSYQTVDHIDTSGNQVWWSFTYDNGLMVGASTVLYEVTGSASYLTNADNLAGYMLGHQVTSSSFGNTLYDGTNTGCSGDCQEFKGPAYRWLMRHYQNHTTQASLYTVLKASADAIWGLSRNTSTNLFAVNWAGPSMTSASNDQDNAAVMALNRFAQYYGAYPGSGIPANRYEAENGTLHNIGLEASNAGFTGWGYIAGWKGDGQWIDFHPNIATAGSHTVTLRYAGGAGNATRLIYINGANAINNLSFPGTGSWGAYNTVSFTYNFPAGTSTLSVIYNSSLGSSNYLNLDNITIN